VLVEPMYSDFAERCKIRGIMRLRIASKRTLGTYWIPFNRTRQAALPAYEPQCRLAENNAEAWGVFSCPPVAGLRNLPRDGPAGAAALRHENLIGRGTESRRKVGGGGSVRQSRLSVWGFASVPDGAGTQFPAERPPGHEGPFDQRMSFDCSPHLPPVLRVRVNMTSS
jgi:hypothetical protein